MIKEISLIIMILVSANKKHPLYNNEHKINDVSSEIVLSANKNNIDPYIVLSWAWHESALRKNAVGKLGETGLMQTHGAAAKMCRNSGYDSMSIECGSFLLSRSRQICGSLKKGLYWYSSGKCAGTPRAKRIVNYRLWRIKKWKKMITK